MRPDIQALLTARLRRQQSLAMSAFADIMSAETSADLTDARLRYRAASAHARSVQIMLDRMTAGDDDIADNAITF